MASVAPNFYRVGHRNGGRNQDRRGVGTDSYLCRPHCPCLASIGRWSSRVSAVSFLSRAGSRAEVARTGARSVNRTGVTGSQQGVTFEEYMLVRGPALIRLARLLVDDVHRALDLVQDALVRAYPRWSDIVRTDQPNLYMRRILINLNASWWRRRGSRELPVDLRADARPDSAGHGAEAAERLTLWEGVRVLPPRQRALAAMCIQLQDLEEARP